MSDPLAQVVSLLKPGLPFTKMTSGAGAWRIEREGSGQVFYTLVVAGASCLKVADKEPVVLQAGDFALIPATYRFVSSSVDPVPPDNLVSQPVYREDGTVRVGRQSGPPEVEGLVGHCTFGSPDAGLLVSLLPDLVVVKGERRLATLAKLVREEYLADRPARDVVLNRLMELLLIEALRSASGPGATPGLLQGLADERLAVALRRMHEDAARSWTVAELAREAALSRSAFFSRFAKAVGATPMEYLLTWRMSLAKDLLRQDRLSIAEVAMRTGYGSTSAFSVAFSRHVGASPAHFVRELT